MTIIHYRQRPKPKQAKAQPASVSIPIVTARKPKRYMARRGELPDDPEANARIREFFTRMGLGEVYDKTVE